MCEIVYNILITNFTVYRCIIRSNAPSNLQMQPLGCIFVYALNCITFGTAIDPFCGSGTFLIEAAFKAMRMAPGLNRRFLAEQWTQIPKAVWRDARAEAVANIRHDAAFEAYGFDVDPEAIALTEENCRKAGVQRRIHLMQRDISAFEPMENAITICNPPYGERMLDIQHAQSIYRIMGDVFPADKAHPCYIITPDTDFELHFGKPANKKRKLYNGMIQCNLMSYYQD